MILFAIASRSLRSPIHGSFSRRTFSALGRPSKQRPKLEVNLNARREFHPIVSIVVRQLLKGVAILTGRGIRKWWTSLPANKRRYLGQQIIKNKFPLFVGFGGLGSFAGLYYALHLEVTPITGRRRFVAFKPEQIDEMTELFMSAQIEGYSNQLYPPNHQYVKGTQTIVNHILNSNRDIQEVYSKNWKVFVVRSPQVELFVTSDGSIFLMEGMLKLCKNTDQLACLLSHEIAHAILNHSAEKFSYDSFVDKFIIIFLGIIWTIIPSNTFAALTHMILNKLTELIFSLPYSRKLETEADLVGLELAAKSCFDIREFSTFWAKLRETSDTDERLEYFSTHPAHSKRIESLDEMLPEAVKKRIESGCKPLSKFDPRSVYKVEGGAGDRIGSRG